MSRNTSHKTEKYYDRMVQWFFASRWRLMLALFVVLAIPFGSVIVLIEGQLEQSLKDRVVLESQRLTELTVETVEEKIEGLVKYTEGYSKRKKFIRLVSQRKRPDIINDHLTEMVTENASVQRVFIADTNGVLIYDAPVDTAVHGQDFSYRDWYKGVIDRGDTYISEIYQRAALGQPFVITVATPIHHPDTDEKVGYLCAQHTMNQLIRWLNQVRVQENSQLLLIDHHGHLPIIDKEASRQTLKKVDEMPALEALMGQSGVQVMHDPLHGSRCLVSYNVAQPMGWTVFYSYSLKQIYAPIQGLQWVITGLILLCFLIVLSVGFFWFDIIRYYYLESKKANEAVLGLNKRLEQKIKALEEANKEMERFSYSVSHDLRSPLRAIHGYLKIIRSDYVDRLDKDAKRIMKRVMHNARQMGQLIDDLLAFFRMGRQEVDRQQVEMRPLVEEICKEFEEQAPDRDLHFEIGQLPVVQADRALMKQVWTNLISNAVKYTGQEEKAVIKIGSEKKKEGLVFYVQDNGVGFDMQHYDKLFGMFERLHGESSFEGTGIGMSIVERIIEKHGGKVWAEGEVGKGATFYFSLPG